MLLVMLQDDPFISLAEVFFIFMLCILWGNFKWPILHILSWRKKNIRPPRSPHTIYLPPYLPTSGNTKSRGKISCGKN